MIRFAAARLADCPVQEARDIACVAPVPGQAALDGLACEGEAVLVLRGRAARIEGLVFAGIRVPDKNGAGIQLENGKPDDRRLAWVRDRDQGVGRPAGTPGTGIRRTDRC